MSTGLSQFNRALNLIPKRAEQRHSEHLRETFLDSGVAVALEAIDHQVLYGRRGTGKTHALRYIQSELDSRGDLAIYADLRTIGSPEGLFMGESLPPAERAGRLLIDLLGLVHEGLLGAALEDDKLLADTLFVTRLDALVAAITSVKVVGDVEIALEDETSNARTRGGKASATISATPSLSLARRFRSGLVGRRVARP